MTQAKPLLKPALNISKEKNEPLQDRWYGPGTATHLDTQIYQLARRGDGDALRQVLDHGLLDPARCEKLTKDRFYPITCFWSQPAAVAHASVIEDWMRLTMDSFPDQALANFRSLIDNGVSKTASPEIAHQLMSNGITACFKSGLKTMQPIRSFMQNVDIGGGSKDRYTNCTILAAAFHRLDEVSLKDLINGDSEHRHMSSIPTVATIFSPKEPADHGRQLNLVEFGIRARISPEKMQSAVAMLDLKHSSIKVELGMCVERYCKTMHSLTESQFQGLAVLLSNGADMRLAGKAHTRNTWGSKTLVHKICELSNWKTNKPASTETPYYAGALKSLVTMTKGQGEKVFDVNAQDADGNTPLHLVAQFSPQAAQILLDAGARTDIRNKSGATAIDLVDDHGNDASRIFFRARTAQLNMQESLPRTSVRSGPRI